MNSIFKALNDKTRRDILELLKKKDLSAGEIAENFSFAKASISHHLDILRQANLVASEKRGQFIYYSLNVTVFDEIVNWVLNLKEDIKNEKK